MKLGSLFDGSGVQESYQVPEKTFKDQTLDRMFLRGLR